MIERLKIEPAEPPTRKSVEACLKACEGWRERNINGIRGKTDPSLREQMARELLRVWELLGIKGV